MYRYGLGEEIVYDMADMVLFRESPFACWMERLTLENPAHGISADVPELSPIAVEAPRSTLVQVLRQEGKEVIAIEGDTDEATRRTATLTAMRRGVNYIVNAQLAVGSLSNCAELLMRMPGTSDLGDYLYVPGETHTSSVQHSAFRLCFLADLLHSLQGRLPSQLLLMHDDSDAVPLCSEDYIYHYRSVKQQFMAAQNAFQKHRMPDPLQSAHFGRWSRYANELLKQSAPGNAQNSAQGAGTLHEQASVLNLMSGTDKNEKFSADTLQNLEFIGSSQHPPSIGEAYSNRTAAEVKTFGEPPPASLRNPANVDLDVLHDKASSFEDSSFTPFNNRLMTNDEDSD